MTMDEQIPHRLTLDGRRRLTVSGVDEVASFDESSIRMTTRAGDLLIRGSSLHIEKLSLDGGDLLVDGTVETDDGLRELWGALLDGASWHRPDHYYVLYDFRSYCDARLRAIYDWRDRESFGRKCLLNVAASGRFSADRAIREYAEKIWEL